MPTLLGVFEQPLAVARTVERLRDREDVGDEVTPATEEVFSD